MLCKSGRGHLKNITVLMVASRYRGAGGMCVGQQPHTRKHGKKHGADGTGRSATGLRKRCGDKVWRQITLRSFPVSSSAVDGGKYQIILDAKGQRSTCLIDQAGTVLSAGKGLKP